MYRPTAEAWKSASWALQLGRLDPLGDLDLLLARQQRNLAHLLQVHPDRIVEDVVLRGARLLLLGLLLALLVVLDLVRLEDLDLEVLQDRQDVVDFLLVFDRLGQRLVDVVEREVALLLRKADQLADLLVDPARSGGIRALPATSAVSAGMAGARARTASTASDCSVAAGLALRGMWMSKMDKEALIPDGQNQRLPQLALEIELLVQERNWVNFTVSRLVG